MMLTVGSLLQNGKYRVEDVLGDGGFGITYRATHNILNQEVVLKTLKSFHVAGLEPEALTERFFAEARCLAQLRHPHIVRVSDCFVEDEVPVIVMDFIAGQTLAQKIVKGPLPEADALRYIRDMGQALTFVHREGLLHRDVKPSNAIVPDDKTQGVTLIDFGVARTLSPDVTQGNTGILSSGFAPLEQYLPAHRWTPATDVYGLAATLYALTTGQTPTASVLRDRIPLTAPRSLNPTLSPQIEHAILEGLALEVGDRPKTIEQWLALLPQDNWLSPLGHNNADRDESTFWEPTLPILEGLLAEPSTQTLMPKAKPSKRRSPAAARRSYTVPSRKSFPQEQFNRWPPFPKRALLLSAIVAGLGGIGVGLYVKHQMLGPSVLPHPSFQRTPLGRIEESFPPKSRSSGLDPNLETPSVDPVPTKDSGSINSTDSSPLPSESVDNNTETPNTPPEEIPQHQNNLGTADAAVFPERNPNAFGEYPQVEKELSSEKSIPSVSGSSNNVSTPEKTTPEQVESNVGDFSPDAGPLDSAPSDMPIPTTP